VERVARLDEEVVRGGDRADRGRDGRPAPVQGGGGEDRDQLQHRDVAERHALEHERRESGHGRDGQGGERVAAWHGSIVGAGQATWITGRRDGSGSAWRSTSRVTGATSPSPNSR
jgi:hypothetical protein